MKNKSIYSLVALIISLNAVAQNWDVFNKNYRYNYVYDNNALVTNVLFVDSISQAGNDTIYYMNRIGVECTGTCPTVTVAITTTATVIVPNMPQFLQRNIIKYANGLVMLSDTAKLVIKPNCSLGESWLFDSINNKNVQCISINTHTLLLFSDSVKTILIDGTDTLKLSKQFGIIQFPNLYNKNKYYKLTGIENKSSYDQTALFGTKVPNAWDFYNFDVGDKFCYHYDYWNVGGASNSHSSVSDETITILNKSVTGTGYTYNVSLNKQIHDWGYQWGNSWNTNTLTTTPNIINYSTSSANLFENMLYPGKLATVSNRNLYNLTKFGVDSNKKFYKYFGPICQTYTNATLPNLNEPHSFNFDYFNPQLNQINENSSVIYSKMFGVGIGLVTNWMEQVGARDKKCMTCVVKNGVIYLGEETFVSIDEKNKANQNIIIYPNPTSGEVSIDTKGNIIAKIEVSNYLGQIILVQDVNETNIKLHLQEYKNGIYFVKIYSKEGQVVIKKVIKH